jgi:hypothetical protein
LLAGGMSPGAVDAWPCRTAPGHQAAGVTAAER